MYVANLQSWLRDELFEHIPLSLSIIDRDYRIVEANTYFMNQFGVRGEQHCYQVYKNRHQPCRNCPAAKAFVDGQVRQSHEKGYNRFGEPVDYVVFVTPVVAEKDSREVLYVLQVSMNITQWVQREKEYRLLYEWAPCYIAILDRDFRIIRGNRRLWRTFGRCVGDHCFEVYKNQAEKCKECPAEKTFQDGHIYHAEQTGRTREGEIAHYIVTSAPLVESGGRIDQVIEVCMDRTHYRTMRTEISKLRAIQESLIEHAYDGIMAVDADGRTIIFNPSLENLLGISKEEVKRLADLERYFPSPMMEIIREGREACVVPSVPIRAKDGDDIVVRFTNVILRSGEENLGHASFFQDLREITQLQREKLEAERLAAVGETVAGIAHGIKNILMGLEGGIYVAKSASRKRDGRLADEGWRMLEDNVGRISTLIKDFLAFSKGREPRVEAVDPNDIAREVIELFREMAEKAGIAITSDLQRDIPPAPMDAQGIHTCLANLVSNALDACHMSEEETCTVRVSTRDENNTIVYRVVDTGCGMDYEVKKKVFTTFFTTKRMGGTGLGLLVTRKIVQEHGGRIEYESAPGEGSQFALIFPRKRLPRPRADDNGQS